MLKWLCLVLVTRVAARLNESCTGVSPSMRTYDGFQCDSGQCVNEWFVCDGVFDCEDYSDEQDCSFSVSLKAMLGWCHTPSFGWGVRCPNGECIQRRLMCDGNKDCLDGADEKCIPYKSSLEVDAIRGTECTMDYGSGRPCRSSSQCIPLHWFCNGDKDCPGGEDEEFCEGPFCQSQLGPGIRCGIQCVPKVDFCDGKKDCFDGRDEANCIDFNRPVVLEVTTSTYTLPTTNRTTTTTTTRAPRPSKSTISLSKLDSEFSHRGHQLPPASEIHHGSSTSNSSHTHIFSFLIPFLLILQTSYIFNP